VLRQRTTTSDRQITEATTTNSQNSNNTRTEMVELNMRKWSKGEGDTVYVEAGRYKYSTATVMRFTPQKMEVVLHAERFKGAVVMINQTSARVIEKAAEDSQNNTPKPRPERRVASRKPKGNLLSVDGAMLNMLEEEMVEMQSKLATMSLVVASLKERERVREAKPQH